MSGSLLLVLLIAATATIFVMIQMSINKTPEHKYRFTAAQNGSETKFIFDVFSNDYEDALTLANKIKDSYEMDLEWLQIEERDPTTDELIGYIEHKQEVKEPLK